MVDVTIAGGGIDVVVATDDLGDKYVIEDGEQAVIQELTGPQGPSGPQGPQGPIGAHRYYGDGPPGLIIGASPGDEYVDRLTGDLYTLQ